jgi:hypothetical protein
MPSSKLAERVSREVVRKQAIPVDDRPSAEPCSRGVQDYLGSEGPCSNANDLAVIGAIAPI